MLTLHRELETFEAELAEMLRDNDGKFAVIHGREVCKVLPTYEAALNWAYDTFGLDRFMVKQINAEEQVAHFSRDIGTCGA